MYAPGAYAPGWSRRPYNWMRRIGAQIRKIASGLGFESSLRLTRLRARWDELIGPPVSFHSWPVFFERGTLTLAVESPAWLQQLSFYSEEIKSKLSVFEIRDIKMRVGSIPERDRLKHEETAPHPIPDKARGFIKDETSGISDPELKEQIAKTMEAWAGRRLARSRGPKQNP